MPDIQTAPFLTVDIFDDIPGIKHGFFTRQGGVSKGIYNSLNTGKGSKDNPDYVEKNMAIISGSLGIKRDHLQTSYQIHSNIVHKATAPAKELPDGDGLVTDQSYLGLGVKTADCVPLLFACKKTKVIGACHAGWGGAFKGIAQNTIKEMVNLGADPEAIHVAIGPCLQQKSFEVGPEFVERFIKQSQDNKQFFIIPEGREKHHFDPIGYLTRQLQSCGVSKISVCDYDTYTHPDLFFSYRQSCHRGEPDYGRQLSVIVRTD